MRHLFAFSMLLAGFLMTTLAPTPSPEQPLSTAGSGNPCTFGEPDYAASCANVNGNRGMLGRADYGAYGYHHTGSFGYLGSNNYGVWGEHVNDNIGFLGSMTFGVWGTHNTGTFGFLGSEDYGSYGRHTSGNEGWLGSNNYGVYGAHANGPLGFLGGSGFGAIGEHHNGNYATLGSGSYGAYGRHNGGNEGYLGSTSVGAYGEHQNGNYGALGGFNYSVYGAHTNGPFAYLGGSFTAVYGSSIDGFAGYFEGNVHVTGVLSKAGGSFKIDHPLDPANRYLSHSFVESPDMMNVYNGNAVLDAAGEAVVELPAYFEALNRDFRYQLTALGAPGPDLYVAEKIQDNRFTIAGGTPGMEVSWLVTGIRHDPWADEHRIVVEEDKPADEQGFYLHPRLYGQPPERSIEWARDPEGMRALQEMPARMEEERQKMQEERQRMDEEHQRMQAERAQRSPGSDNQR